MIKEVVLKHNELGDEFVSLRCDCGALVGGSSIKHCEANLKLHRRSKRHTEFIEVKKALLKKGGEN